MLKKYYGWVVLIRSFNCGYPLKIVVIRHISLVKHIVNALLLTYTENARGSSPFAPNLISSTLAFTGGNGSITILGPIKFWII